MALPNRGYCTINSSDNVFYHYYILVAASCLFCYDKNIAYSIMYTSVEKRMAVTEKRTQIYFPLDLYRKIRKRAEQESKSLAFMVREAVENYLEEDKNQGDWDGDPFFHAVGIMDSGKGDLAENHDRYLYGKKKKDS